MTTTTEAQALHLLPERCLAEPAQLLIASHENVGVAMSLCPEHYAAFPAFVATYLPKAPLLRRVRWESLSGNRPVTPCGWLLGRFEISDLILALAYPGPGRKPELMRSLLDMVRTS